MNNKNYSADWADTIRPAILKRDNYHCRKCRVKHRAKGYYENKKTFVECDEFMVNYAKENNFKLITVILQVHHKNCNKKDNSDSNLITLCPKCHFDADREYNILKKKCKGIIFKR